MINKNFEFKYLNNLLHIYNYKKIAKLKSDLIIINYDMGELLIKGSKIIIQELYKEYIIINGSIDEIILNRGKIND